jgi:hypothetical protein
MMECILGGLEKDEGKNQIRNWNCLRKYKRKTSFVFLKY